MLVCVAIAVERPSQAGAWEVFCCANDVMLEPVIRS